MRTTLIILSFILMSCSSGTKAPSQEQAVMINKAVYEKGKVIEQVKCGKDASISYSLYLPSKYDTAGSFPVIVFLDAEARGKLAVSRLKKVAEKLGFIVVGSLDSKNGLTPDRYEYIANTIFDDIKNTLAINSKRIYTAGFSGGSRQAMLLALKRNDIAGVIGCSAGMPQWNEQLPATFFYVGMAGYSDFNFGEMVSLQRQLFNSPLPHQFIYRQGRHEMPSSLDFERAVTLLQINAMATNAADRNDSTINYFIRLNENNISELKKKNMLYDVYENYSLLAKQLEGITNTSSYKAKIDELTKSKSFLTLRDQDDKSLIKESELQKSYSQAMNDKGIDWWKLQISSLHQNSKDLSSPYNALMSSRLLAYIALMAHMNYDAAVKQNLADRQKMLLDIKVLAEPAVPMGYYLLSVYYSRTGNQQESLKMINKAVAFGFSDEGKYNSEALLSSIRNSGENTGIIQKIRDNFRTDIEK